MFQIMPHPTATLAWWYSQRANVDMTPPYQRKGHLWSDRDKGYLIDSILNNYDIPKIYLADFAFVQSHLNTRGLRYAVIDGKQRLEAIFDFFSGALTLCDDFVLLEDPKRRLAGMGYRELRTTHDDIADRFENFNLTVMSVITDDDARINDLFVRLNTSKPLTGAEIRNAMEGEVPELIRHLAENRFFKSKIKFSTKRGAGLETAAKLLLLEFAGKLTDTKKKHLDNMVAVGVNAQSSDLTGATSRVEKNLERMSAVFNDRDVLLATQGPVTLYYWFIRALPDCSPGVLREFLAEFETRRKERRDQMRAGNKDPYPALALFEEMHRSTNDAMSLRKRFELLSSSFGAYLDDEDWPL